MHRLVPQRPGRQLDPLARRPHPLLVVDQRVQNRRLPHQIEQLLKVKQFPLINFYQIHLSFVDM